MRLFFKLFMMLIIAGLCYAAYLCHTQGDTVETLKAGAVAFILAFILAIFEGKKKTSKPTAKQPNATPAKMPKYMAAILTHAHRALQRDAFYCRQCSKKKPIAEAALIDVSHMEEFINNDDEDIRTRKTHDYSGLICTRCARVVANLSNDEHTYYNIPDELRAGDE